MQLLILGGTRFLGRSIAEHAVGAGHQVTMFNRGSHPEVVPEARRIVGDRTTADIDRLRGTSWDCVADVNAYRPAEVRAALSALAGGFQHYVYVSTVSVYAHPVPGAAEDAPLLTVPEDVASADPDAYGGLKAACEGVLRESVGAALTVLRPTVVIGPYDYTDRFSWWVRHVAQGHVEVPRRLAQPVQLIDAEDLGAFALRTVEERISGTFNCAGPEQPLTLEGLLGVLAGTFGVQPQLLPGDGERIPLTLPEDGSEDGVFSVSTAAARAAGLRTRALADSAAAVLAAQHHAAESR